MTKATQVAYFFAGTLGYLIDAKAITVREPLL